MEDYFYHFFTLLVAFGDVEVVFAQNHLNIAIYVRIDARSRRYDPVMGEDSGTTEVYWLRVLGVLDGDQPRSRTWFSHIAVDDIFFY